MMEKLVRLIAMQLLKILIMKMKIEDNLERPEVENILAKTIKMKMQGVMLILNLLSKQRSEM